MGNDKYNTHSSESRNHFCEIFRIDACFVLLFSHSIIDWFVLLALHASDRECVCAYPVTVSLGSFALVSVTIDSTFVY